MRYLLVAAITLVLSGCATNRPIVERWVGHQITEVEQTFGTPTFSSVSADGLRVITWDFVNPRRGTKVCRKSFTVDGAGTITSVSYRGCSFYSS